MKIYGLGTDIVDVKRIKSVLTRNKSFKKRIFTKSEISFCENKKKSYYCYAKRFAAKEAFAKSIGTGFRNNLNFKDIEILNNNIGKPYFLKSKKINEIVKKRFKIKKFDLFLSISDEKDYSVAFTILQSK